MERADHHRPGPAAARANPAIVVLLALALATGGCSGDDETAAEPSTRDTVAPDAGATTVLQATIANDGSDADNDEATSTTDASTGDRSTQEGDGGRCGSDRPTEIRFRTGTTSATLDVPASAGQRDRYTLDVGANQIMTVRLESDDETARANLLAPGGNGASSDFVEQTTAPTRAGMYQICVIAGSIGADYELTVSIIDDNTPTRIDAPWCGETVNDRGAIRFETGRSSGTVDGGVVLGQRDLYDLEAEAGQDIDLFLASAEDNAVFDLLAPSGQIITREVADLRLPLPESGVYQICIGSVRGNASYVLDVAIT